MNNRRKVVFALGASAVTAAFGSFAQQQQTKIYRIGYLDPGSASNRADRVEWLRAGLRDLGYIENKNIFIEFRWGDGKYARLPLLAAELARMKVDVLVVSGTPGTIAAKQATKTIPIVMVSVGDPVVTGLVSSLARPSGNVTGLSNVAPGLVMKWFELLNETSPRTKKVAFLVNPSNPSTVNNFKAAEIVTKSLKMGLQKFEAKNFDEIKNAFVTMTTTGADAIAVSLDAMLAPNYVAIAILAEKQRLPSLGPPEFAEAGGLIGFGALQSAIYRRATIYVDKILRGTKPADIPVEQPTTFELVVNMKTAKALGISVPNSILVRADKLIE